MALAIRLSTRARDDLRHIRSYLLENAGSGAAERVRLYLRDRIHRLGTSPYIGVKTLHPDVRLLPPGRYPCRIFYSIEADAVVILHVRHSARDDVDVGGLLEG